MLIPRLALRALLPALLLAALGALTTGCYTTTLIPPAQATRLARDALTFPDELRAVRDVNGQIVVLGESFTAQVETSPTAPPMWAAWGASEHAIKSPFLVDVRGPILALRPDNEPPLEVPLAYVKQIRVREFSTSNTVGLVLGVTAGVGVIVLSVLLYNFRGDSTGMNPQ